MADQVKKKRGPDPERLKIELDPEEALRRLLTKRPPESNEAEDEPEKDEGSQGD